MGGSPLWLPCSLAAARWGASSPSPGCGSTNTGLLVPRSRNSLWLRKKSTHECPSPLLTQRLAGASSLPALGTPRPHGTHPNQYARILAPTMANDGARRENPLLGPVSRLERA